MKKKVRTISILLILTALIGFGATAHAAVNRTPLAAFSPTNNAFGMPQWYQGQNGQQLELCLDLPTYDITLDPTCAPIQDPCLLDIGMIPNPGGTACIPDPVLNPVVTFDPRNPIVFPTNFPAESFYYMGDAQIDNAGPFNSLRMNAFVHLEVAFLGDIIAGGHVIFSRIQVDPGTDAGANPTNKLRPNQTYTFTFPMGEITATADAVGNIPVLRHEMGCGAPPCNPALAITLDPFQPVTTNIIGPNFLGAAALGFPGPIPGYTGIFIGDPNVGAQLIQPGVNGAFFRVDGPDVGGVGVNTIQTTAFSILGKQFAAPVLKKWVVDFEGNGSTDMTVFRDGVWFVRPSSGAAPFGVSWGVAGDIPVAGDYDGDNVTDMAIYRNGQWFIVPSATPAAPFAVSWGVATDKPVQGDYNGDGRTDLAIYRPGTGEWFVTPSGGAAPSITSWGGNPVDKAVPADYDGDGRIDMAVYRGGTWFIKPSSVAPAFGVGWGGDATDVPVPGDYDGDQKADVAVYRAASGAWFVRPASGAAPFAIGWGGDATDKPVPGDYDNDGITDMAVYRAASGAWFVRPSSAAVPFGIAWGGAATDIPVTLLVP